MIGFSFFPPEFYSGIHRPQNNGIVIFFKMFAQIIGEDSGLFFPGNPVIGLEMLKGTFFGRETVNVLKGENGYIGINSHIIEDIIEDIAFG
jgi:hypothetical protein